MFFTELVTTEIGEESPQKRIKNCGDERGAGKSLSCFAKLDVTFKYELISGRNNVDLTAFQVNKISPFALEHHRSKRQVQHARYIKNKFCTILAERKKFSFLVCHNVDKFTEIVLIANTVDVKCPEEEMFLKNFCIGFRQLTNTCLRNTNLQIREMTNCS